MCIRDRFRTIPASEAAGIIVQNTGASREQARMAVEALSLIHI